MEALDKMLQKMDATLDELIAVATELKELSKGTVVPTQLEELQQQQEELVAKLCEQDADLRKNNGKGPDRESVVWARIQDKMDAFSDLNKEFIENIKVRKGLIQFEIQQVKKSRKAVAKMKDSYAPPKPQAVDKRKSRVNTVR